MNISISKNWCSRTHHRRSFFRNIVERLAPFGIESPDGRISCRDRNLEHPRLLLILQMIYISESQSSDWNVAMPPKERLYMPLYKKNVHIILIFFGIFHYISTLRSGSRYRPPFGIEIRMHKSTWGGGRISFWNRNVEHPRFLLSLPRIYTGIEPNTPPTWN